MLASKISGFRMFFLHPYSTPAKIPPTYPLYNPDNYCKISLSGGLAQRVKQRTLKCYVIKDCYEG